MSGERFPGVIIGVSYHFVSVHALFFFFFNFHFFVGGCDVMAVVVIQ